MPIRLKLSHYALNYIPLTSASVAVDWDVIFTFDGGGNCRLALLIKVEEYLRG